MAKREGLDDIIKEALRALTYPDKTNKKIIKQKLYRLPKKAKPQPNTIRNKER